MTRTPKLLYMILERNIIVTMYVTIWELNEKYNNVNQSCIDETAYVLRIFCVLSSSQNRRIGKKVLIYVEGKIENMGYEQVRLDVFSKNPFAQKLYRTNGYEVRGYVDWRKGRFDLMEKKL